jgi:Uma2 family endonuclease
METLISVDEYLNTSYDPDREYLDGRVVERNLGELDHSELQTELSSFLNVRRKQLGIRVFVEQRVQVRPTRFRVPDISIVVGPRPRGRILVDPPFLCVEILSREDRAGDFQERIDDYLEFGVQYVWVIDPRKRRGWVHSMEGAREAKDGILRTTAPEITVPLAEIFRALE